MRAPVAYAPAIVLLAAGLVVLATLPLSGPIQCSCTPGPNGTCLYPPCPTGRWFDPLGPILLVGAILAAVLAFALRLRRAR